MNWSHVVRQLAIAGGITFITALASPPDQLFRALDSLHDGFPPLT